ncbi:MAG: phosphoribosyl-ATP diphosphatase [Alphaproteobacteria bacterium]|nr:phosphoribosyl-ATP diphosphatase [Alphaproteobacteria bacterium]
MTDKPADSAVLERLFKVIRSRRGGDAEKSYTAELFAGGTGTIPQKFGEEAVETIIAALLESPAKVTRESADLLYHLLVLWAEAGIEPADVWAELQRREGTSGLAEKKARSNTKGR